MITDSDEVLVRGAQGGDRGAFEEMVRRTSRLVFARLYLETGDAHRAEDLLQETLLNAFRSLRELADPKGFRPWLLKIAQNVVLDVARYDSRRKRAGPVHGNAAVLETLADKEPSPDDQVAREELRGQVLAILRSLPEDYRLPLTLRYIGGADYETIQTQLGLTNGALRGLLHRGLKLLRARLPRDFESNCGEGGASAS
jgi:RNA polymerase sigma-70 factor (ECF subfamily)